MIKGKLFAALVVAVVSVALVEGCADFDPDSERVDFDPPEDAGTSPSPLPESDAGVDAPVEPVTDCLGQANFVSCTWLDDAPGVCVFGRCNKACERDDECEANACSPAECLFGTYCVPPDSCD